MRVTPSPQECPRAGEADAGGEYRPPNHIAARIAVNPDLDPERRRLFDQLLRRVRRCLLRGEIPAAVAFTHLAGNVAGNGNPPLDARRFPDAAPA